MTEDTRWKDIFKHLKSKGFRVYSPGVKEGECEAPYVVLKDAGDTKADGTSATQRIYDLLLYVPKNQYSELEVFVNSVCTAMDGLWPMIRPLHTRTTPFYDDDYKAWMTSVQYANYRKNKRP